MSAPGIPDLLNNSIIISIQVLLLEKSQHVLWSSIRLR